MSATLKVLRCSLSNIDPAIDVEAMRATQDLLAQYITTRDSDLLAMRPGVTPVWFHLRRLPAAWLPTLDTVFPLSEQRALAFRASCHLIEGAAEPMCVHPAETKDARFVAGRSDRGVSLAPDAWLQEVVDLFGAEVVQEMGLLAIRHSVLPRGARGPFGFWGGSALTG